MRRASDERNETAAAAAFLNPSRFIIVANASWRRRPALRNGEKKTKYEQASEVIWRMAASRRISSSAAGARRANNAQCTHQVILGQKLQCTFGSSYTVLGGI